jgi:DNA-binding NtrC family response regulator
MLRVLLVDDDPDIRNYVGAAIREHGHAVTEAVDGEEAMEHLVATRFDVVVSDIRLPKHDGIAVFRRARRESPQTDVILMTSFAAVPQAVAAMKEGAYDYLTKPFEADELLSRLDRIAAKHALERELEDARATLEGSDAAMTIVGESPPMARLRDRIAMVAASDAPVLVTGESGTGKELVARMLHTRSARRGAAFVAVNCAAFPETLLEAELFGHERGAFTGAAKKRDGRFKAAHGGTLLLDEIAETPLAAQAKLLRVLQEGTIEPLGTNESVKVDVRVVSATNRDLKRRIADGLFREDLYYRLNVVNIVLPPLRERRADLPLLLHHFLRRFVPAAEPLPELSLRAWAVLTTYAFPGNVRELSHAVQHAVVLAHGSTIDLEHLPEDIVGASVATPLPDDVAPLNAAIKRFEREYLLRALAAAGGKRVRAAELLGISRKNLWEKLRAHGISDADVD